MIGSSMLLATSASEPLRMTIAASSLPELARVLRMPAASISAAASTNTTRAMPNTASRLLVLRTVRLRRLYRMGIIGLLHAPQRIDYVELGDLPSGKEGC